MLASYRIKQVALYSVVFLVTRPLKVTLAANRWKLTKFAREEFDSELKIASLSMLVKNMLS